MFELLGPHRMQMLDPYSGNHHQRGAVWMWVTGLGSANQGKSTVRKNVGAAKMCWGSEGLVQFKIISVSGTGWNCWGVLCRTRSGA